MAKTVNPSTTLKSIEKNYGPVLPGQSSPGKTISVFQEYSSRKKYKLCGQLGIIDGAIWHLHTQIPIDPAKVKGRITGIIEEGNQHDPNRRQRAAQWLVDHQAGDAAKREAADKKAIATAAAAEKKRQKEMAGKRTGEYDAQLYIGGTINMNLDVRVKIDAKGKVTFLVPGKKGLYLPPLQ